MKQSKSKIKGIIEAKKKRYIHTPVLESNHIHDLKHFSGSKNSKDLIPVFVPLVDNSVKISKRFHKQKSKSSVAIIGLAKNEKQAVAMGDYFFNLSDDVSISSANKKLAKKFNSPLPTPFPKSNGKIPNWKRK